ncbi:M23 family metallopeptidase [Arcanobacterium hippocoleae]|uniref:M23 family metallopeptidase n=1 Tax=Arcanobacterium hippocoleae TaxID=149017 RepID=UPI00333F645D
MSQELLTGKTLPSRKELRLARQAAERAAQLEKERENPQQLAGAGLPCEMPEIPRRRRSAQRQEKLDREKVPNLSQVEKQFIAVQGAAEVLASGSSTPSAKMPEKLKTAEVTTAIPAISTCEIETAAGQKAFNAKFASAASVGLKKSSALHNFIRKSPALSAVAVAGVVVASIVGVMEVQNAVGTAGLKYPNSVLNTVTAKETAADGAAEILEPTSGSVELAKLIETQMAANSGKLRCVDYQGANSLNSAYESPEQKQVFFPMETGSYHISSPFGMRKNPTGRGMEFHTGVDFAAPAGTPIYAAADGVVEMDGSETPGNNDVRIRHEIDGKVFYTWYLHSYRDGIFVKVGQKVKAGEKIAEVGSSGRSTGPHLHFEIRPTKDYSEKPVEPVSFISQLGAIDISQKCE